MTCSQPPPLADSLRIAIIGGGLGGLSCALGCARAGFKHVTIYEQARMLSEIGNGIGIAPNMCRVLDHYGVYETMCARACVLEHTSIRSECPGFLFRFISFPRSFVSCFVKDGSNKELASVLVDHHKTKYGYPYMVRAI